MSDHKPEKKIKAPRAFGWMAEYKDENELLSAARKVRDSGYTRTDAFTPFPVHGIDEALGIKPTVLPWFTFFAGATGTTVALTMQYWMNAVDYMYIISGKPFASWPAFIPVAFELTVLFAAFTTVFAMFALNGLPRFSNPVFTNPKFDRSTDDRFFLWIDSRDKYFNSDKVKGLLQETSPLDVEEVREDDSPTEIPRALITVIATLILLTLVPGAIVLNMRAAKSGQTRFHVFFDMDFQPYRETQTGTTLFADGRVQRPPVPGTIARGDLELSDPYYLGFDPEATAMKTSGTDMRLVSFLQQQEGAKEIASEKQEGSEAQEVAKEGTETAEQGSEKAPEAEATTVPTEDTSETAEPAAQAEAQEANQDPAAMPDSEPEKAWITEFPIEVNEELYNLGKNKFEQNCSVCHGYAGYGNGLVHQRAAALAQGYWLQPTSLHEQRIQEQAIGRIYYTIANGKGKMGGYGSTITPKERWAIVLYVRALQRSQNAKPSDAPAGAFASAPSKTSASE